MEAEHCERRPAMMKRVIIVCEGPTEKEFCQEILLPHFQKLNITIEAPLIKQSGGGIVPWHFLKNQLVRHLSEGDAVVTTFIDYYGIKKSHEFPGWDASQRATHNIDKARALEEAMSNEIPDECRHRFVPHIQMHEFESLLFSDVDAFAKNFADDDLDLTKLRKVVNQFDNPEDINNSPTTAPSKRILDAVKSYSKVLDGNCVAMDIGLDRMRQCCPHFNEWISELEKI
jgi:hypothetical protein